jgi:arginyl-tRNA synthetase
MIVQKQDGAFLYATTDLATLEYRQEKYRPDEVVYVVDHRQGDHFEKLFLVAAKWGLGGIKLRHVSFGTVLGKDGKPFKTRSGSSVGLESLLDDAVAEGYRVVCNPDRILKFSPPPTDSELEHISQVVGYGGIKYFDLLHHRTSDYVFDLQQMVSLDGNAAAYVQYAYARVQSLLRNANTTVKAVQEETQRIEITQLFERQLILQLIRFAEAIDQSLEDYRPNLLVDYLYQLSKAFSSFFETCRVLDAPTMTLRQSRLAIAALVGLVLKQGLGLLGIDVVDRM